MSRRVAAMTIRIARVSHVVPLRPEVVCLEARKELEHAESTGI